ncbi:MAG: hypothetical protein ACTIDA_06045 [Pseudolactococcus laudensis]
MLVNHEKEDLECAPINASSADTLPDAHALYGRINEQLIEAGDQLAREVIKGLASYHDGMAGHSDLIAQTRSPQVFKLLGTMDESEVFKLSFIETMTLYGYTIYEDRDTYISIDGTHLDHGLKRLFNRLKDMLHKERRYDAQAIEQEIEALAGDQRLDDLMTVISNINRYRYRKNFIAKLYSVAPDLDQTVIQTLVVKTLRNKYRRLFLCRNASHFDKCLNYFFSKDKV